MFYTLPDVFDERFGKPTGILPAILQAFIYAVPTLALQIVAMGFLFQTLFGIQLWVSLVVSWAIISGYTLLGGLPSVILTDSIQSIVLLVGIVLMGVATWGYAGGISEIVPAVPESHFTFLGADPLDTIFFALSIGPFYLVWQSTWQRFYASRTEGIARWGGFTGFFFAGIVLSVVSTAIGLSARTFLKGEIEPDAVFYTVLQQVLPPFLGGILAMGLMAALIAAALVYAATIFATALAVPWQETGSVGAGLGHGRSRRGTLRRSRDLRPRRGPEHGDLHGPERLLRLVQPAYVRHGTGEDTAGRFREAPSKVRYTVRRDHLYLRRDPDRPLVREAGAPLGRGHVGGGRHDRVLLHLLRGLQAVPLVGRR